MRRREPINPASPIPELIKLIKHSFRECEFDEVQNILMEREKRMEVEIENVVRDRDSLKKQVDFLENIQSYLELEKCELKEKLGRSQRRGLELDEMIVQSKEKLCEEIEDLRREKLCASKTIEELKAKEFEADRVVQELKRKDVEAVKTIDELRANQMKCEKANAEDRALILSPKGPATPDAGVGTLAHSVTKGDDEGKEPLVSLLGGKFMNWKIYAVIGDAATVTHRKGKRAAAYADLPSKPATKRSKSERRSDMENEKGSSDAEKLKVASKLSWLPASLKKWYMSWPA